jgi:hypothetical protein
MSKDMSNDEKLIAPATVETYSTPPVGKDVAACGADSGAACQFDAAGDGAQVGSQRISLDELRRLWQANEPVTILDVRTERSLEGDDAQAKGAVRMPPDHVADRAKELGLKQEAWLVAYCT